MRNKGIALLIAGTVLCMTACGGKTQEPETVVTEAEETADASEETVAEPTDVVAVEAVDAAEEEIAESDENQETEVTEEGTAAEEEEIQPGTNDGSVYENAFFGIGCKLDSDWAMKSEEEILQNNNLAKEMVGEEYAQMFESGAVVTDMYATNVNEVDTLNAGIEKLTGMGTLADEKTYLEASDSKLVEVLGSMGIENLQTTQKEENIAGKLRPTLLVEGEYSGVKVYEKLMPVKKGDYMLVVTVCSWVEDKTDAYLALFYMLEEN